MSDVRELDLPITRVTLFEDRAEVTREGVVSLEGGAERLRVSVTPLAHEERTTARLHLEEGASGEAHVDDLKVRRRYVPREGEDAARATSLLDDIAQHEQAVAEAEARLKRADERRGALEKTLSRYVEQVARRLARGDGDLETPRGGLEALEEELRRLDDERAEARERAAEHRREAARLTGLLAPKKGRDARYAGEALLRVSSTGGRARLVLSYVVPCALWRPTHEALLHADDRVRWTTHGTVWQRTGEDWTDVALTLSTARPSAGARLPELTADKLRLRTKAPEERRQIIVEHRDEAIPRTDLGGAAPGVYDGGEARVFTARRPLTVPSDGRPHRVPLERFTADARTERVVLPDVAPQVFLRATLENALERPLLAGPVTLLDERGYLGTGDIGYVGPREEYELAFGSDDRFLVKRERRRLEEDRLLGLAKERVTFVTLVRLSYSGTSDGKVTVLLRLPKSEVKQLKVLPVDKHCSEGEPSPDEHGVVRMPVVVAPGGWREVSLGFRFDTSGDVRIPDPW